jgi:hypothetical protein
MKKLPCSKVECAEQERWATGKPRGVQYVEVSDDYTGKVYCSITCAVLSGDMVIRPTQGYCSKCGWKLTFVGDNDHEPENSGAICLHCKN